MYDEYFLRLQVYLYHNKKSKYENIKKQIKLLHVLEAIRDFILIKKDNIIPSYSNLYAINIFCQFYWSGPCSSQSCKKIFLTFFSKELPFTFTTHNNNNFHRIKTLSCKILTEDLPSHPTKTFT